MSEYTDGMQRSRRDMLRTISDTDKQISAIYRTAYQDLARQAAGKKDGGLTKRWQLDMSRSLEERIRQLNGDVTATVLASAKSAGQLPGRANADWLDLALAQAGKPGTGDTFRSVMTRTSDEALRKVVTGAAYLDSKSLSRRIWKTSAQAREGINAVIRQAIAQKKSAYQLAKELEQFVKPDAREDMDWSKVYPDIPHGLLPMYVDKHAQTVARTSINHAYHLAMVEAAEKNPFATCIHWALSPQHFQRQVRPFGADICDEYAIHDEGLGMGNWPIRQVPLPHPRCLCAQYAVVPKSLDECADDLKRWLNGESNPELDAGFAGWKNSLQSSAEHDILQVGKDAGTRRREAESKIASRSDVQAMSRDRREKFMASLVNYSTDNLELLAKGRLPTAGQVNIPQAKLTYALKGNADHARRFWERLGIRDGDQERLREQINEHLDSHDYRLKVGINDEYGERYAAIMPMKGKDGKESDVCVPWIMDAKKHGELRLTSAYIEE